MSRRVKREAEEGVYVGTMMLGEDHTSRVLVSSRPKKLRIRESKIPDLNMKPPDEEQIEEKTTEQNFQSCFKPQDADYSDKIPQLPYELELEILARVPRVEYWNLQLLNKRISCLLRSAEIFQVRRERGLVEPSVFMRSNCETRWTTFDKEFKNCRKLPELPSDFCFSLSDKETLCAGTHMIVMGREEQSLVVWRYELETNKWFKGPSMITPRILFASATNGTFAFVAGGLKVNENGSTEVVNRAEKYDSDTKTWLPLPGMHKRRQFCSGCYLGNKFYVLGGRDENDQHLTCGESYDEATNSWELIPDMMKDRAFLSFLSPPLIAVVKEKLYSLETSSNELRVYVKSTNTWKKLGHLPVVAETSGGWGVAFKSLGDRLLVIGASSAPTSPGQPMSVYTCCPSAEEELRWVKVQWCSGFQHSHFIHNCAVMFA